VSVAIDFMVLGFQGYFGLENTPHLLSLFLFITFGASTSLGVSVSMFGARDKSEILFLFLAALVITTIIHHSRAPSFFRKETDGQTKYEVHDARAIFLWPKRTVDRKTDCR